MGVRAAWYPCTRKNDNLVLTILACRFTLNSDSHRKGALAHLAREGMPESQAKGVTHDGAVRARIRNGALYQGRAAPRNPQIDPATARGRAGQGLA